MSDDDVRRVAALEEPVRREAFDLLRRARRPLTREDVAVELGITRKLAAFHLEKLLDSGLLAAHYARPAGRAGPGAGRTAKFYEPAGVEVGVSVPPRRYDLAGELLLQSVLQQGARERAKDTALRLARRRGRAHGEAVRAEKRVTNPTPQRVLKLATEVLEGLGFEPYAGGRGKVALRNCPFESFAKQAPELMCGMNRAFIDGVLQGIGGGGSVDAVLTCEPGDCCVTLRVPGADPPR